MLTVFVRSMVFHTTLIDNNCIFIYWSVFIVVYFQLQSFQMSIMYVFSFLIVFIIIAGMFVAMLVLATSTAEFAKNAIPLSHRQQSSSLLHNI